MSRLRFSFVQCFGPWELMLVIKPRHKSPLPIIPTPGIQPTSSSVDDAFLNKIYGIIDQHLDDDTFCVDTFSREAGLSRVQLYRRVKALTGLSPNQLVRSTRVQRSAVFMQDQQVSISEVAYRVGFNSLSYFTKCFKSEFGMFRSQFR